MKKVLLVLSVTLVYCGSYLNWLQQTTPYRYVLNVVDQVRFNKLWEEFKQKTKTYFDSNPQKKIYTESIRLHGQVAPIQEYENYKTGTIFFESASRKEPTGRMTTYEFRAFKFAAGTPGTTKKAAGFTSLHSTDLAIEEIIIREIQKILASLQSKPGYHREQAEITLPREPGSLNKWVKFEHAGKTNSIYYKLTKTQRPNSFRLIVTIYNVAERR